MDLEQSQQIMEHKAEIIKQENQDKKCIDQQIKLKISQILVYDQKQWISINPQFTGNKEMQFISSRNQYEFWKSKVANNSKNIFLSLYPCQIITSIVTSLNRRMMVLFPDQDERELNKRKFRQEQIHEYFGVKILMGYNRMPDPEDYFNPQLPFRSKICELIKEGRFKYIEQNTLFNDDLLLQIKYYGMAKQEVDNRFQTNGVIINYITKKLNKQFRLSINVQQCLAIVKNSFLDLSDSQPIVCLLLIDVKTQYIVAVKFCYQQYVSDTILNMLAPFYFKNHKLYFQNGLLNLEIVNILAKDYGIYACGLLEKSKNDNSLVFSSDLITNNIVMLLKLIKGDQGEYSIFASTADAFSRFSSTDKRSYVTVIYQEYIKIAEQFAFESDNYKYQFSAGILNRELFNEVQEIVIWNAYIAYKKILSINNSINFLDFRLELAQQFLEQKLKHIPNINKKPQQQFIPKQSSLGINTDVIGHFNPEDFQILPKYNFHIPCLCKPPKKLRNKIVCIVCRQQPIELVECRSCCEISGRLISLCPKECFSMFHSDPKIYVDQAEQLPVLKESIQFELSSLAQSKNYRNSYQQNENQ